MRVTMNVNGVAEEADVEPRTLLVFFLRNQLGLTGTNIGCDTTSCGACTVLLDGDSVKSCTVLAVQAEGRSITTIEGLSQGDELHPMQQAFREQHGLQCGYCTPGMVMAAVSLVSENPDLNEHQVREGLEGNMCRCTGYHNIVAAVLDAARSAREELVIPASFDYLRAGSLEEAVAALSEHGDEAKLLAGGHSLLPLMKLRLATPSVLIDIGRLPELSYVRDDGEHIAIGALTRHHDVQHDATVVADAPLLATVAGRVGDPQVRHRGTIGGSIAHGDSASDLPAAVLAMGGNLVARGPRGEREIAASDFFVGFLETALAPDEVLVEVRVPKGTSGHAYQKFVRRSQDWAIVGVAAVRLDGRFNVALVNVASTPVRASGVEEALAGGATTAEAAERADAGLEPSGDNNATPEFRRHLARVLTRRALEEATG